MGVHDSSSTAFRSTLYQWILAALAAATLFFGYRGNTQYEDSLLKGHTGASTAIHSPDRLTVVYHTCQLLIAHGAHLEGEIPWQLHAGRLCGVLLLFATALIAFVKFFRDELLVFRFRLPWQRNHVIVCGLGDLGLRLVLDARLRKKFVVVVEKRGDPSVIEQARAAGALVLDGDACSAATLRKVRLARAESIFASCTRDQTNVAVAAIVGQMLPAKLSRSDPLVCRLLFHDPSLRELLAHEAIFPATRSVPSLPGGTAGYRINFSDLDLHDTAARQCLRRHPLDFQPILQDDRTVVHLIVVGFSAMGWALALHAARIGHFANEVPRDFPDAKPIRLRITVLDRDAKVRLDEFRSRFSKIDLVCDISSQDADPLGPGFLKSLDALCLPADGRKDELITFAVCCEKEQQADDRENLRIGLELSQRTKGLKIQTLIFQGTRCGYASLFPDELRGKEIGPRLHPFGMREDIYTWDILLHEGEDRLARALHDEYQALHPDQGHKDWECLEDEFKESNRHAADHIPIKLRAVGYHDTPLQPGRQRIEQFTEDEILLLSKMEHARWCAERWLAGWDYEPETNREKKKNKNLRPWNELLLKEQDKDPEQIKMIARTLEDIGRGIYR